MKILHVSRSVAEFSYHESIIRQLCARGHQVHALFNRMYSENVSDQALRSCAAETPRLTVDWSVAPGSLQRSAAVALHEVASFASFLTRTDQSAHYLAAWEASMPPSLRRLVTPRALRALIARPGSQRALRSVGHRLKADPAVLRAVREIAPDVVVASPTNMRYSYEAEYVRAARALGIRSVIPVFSWDNLTNKGLLPVHPDLLLAWNPTQAREAVNIHGVPAERVAITGSPFFDKWFSSLVQRAKREAFCHKVGLDPGRPFVCYLGSTNNIARDESWLVTEIARTLGSHSDPGIRAVQILVRPHPRNAAIFQGMEEQGIRVWPRAGALPDSGDTLGDFAASLGHSVAAVGVNTTGMLDAIVADTPVLTLLVDRYRATQAATSHFQHLLASEVLGIAESVEGLAGQIGELMAGVDRKREARRRFVQEFIRPHGLDTAAGEVAARAIEGGAVGERSWLTAA